MAVKSENLERKEMLDTSPSSSRTKQQEVAKTACFRLGGNDFHRDNTVSRTASLVSDSSSSSEDSFRLHYYTRAEIARHNTEASAWIVAGENIYDVTDYIEHHPGGRYSIMKKIGGVVDCTRDLNFHSKSGQKYWDQFLVGKITKNPTKNKLPVEKEWWKFWE